MEVARKSFPAKGDFRKEARNLARLNGSLSQHQRIVKYLAVITIGDEQDQGTAKDFHILLPLADADLEHFLYDQCYDSRCGNIADLVREASNLSDAIRWLHGGLFIDGKVLVCCHMDLKLDNILVYLNYPSRVGCWKISDFGISSMVECAHEHHSPRQPSPALLSVPSPALSLARITGPVRISVHRPAGAYTAPEVDFGNQVGTSSDIWSFGCILFQILARGAGGIALLNELDNKRGAMEDGSTNDYFCQQTDRGQRLHPSVSEWLESPKSLPNGSFQDRVMVMNCKRLIQKTLSIKPDGRPDARLLHERLVKIANGEGDTYHFDHDSKLTLLPEYNPDIEVTSSSASLPPYLVPGLAKPIPDRTATLPLISPPSSEPAQLGENSAGLPSTSQQGLHTPPLDETLRNHTPAGNHGDQFPKPSRYTSEPAVKTPDRSQRHHTTPASTLPEANSYQQDPRWTSRWFVDTSPPLGYGTVDDFPQGRSRQPSSDVPGVGSGRTDTRGETIPFVVPSNVLATLVSSTRAKVVFIAAGEASVYTLYSPYSKKTIFPPHGCVWEKGSLAGDFLALRGFCSSTGTYVSITVQDYY